MRVLFVASEAAPWVQVGGLGDVIGSLPKVLRELGVDARICLPSHGGVARHAPDAELIARFSIPEGDALLDAEVRRAELDTVPVYLVGGGPIPPDGVVYTARMDEEGRRFGFFSLAVVELCRRLEWRPDVLHAHDWHAAVAVAELAARRSTDPALAAIASLLTIHNLPYSGNGAQGALAALGVRATDDPRLHESQRAIPLALGLVAADALSTVSEGYAREILEPEHGHGFDRLLRSRADDLSAIRNGIDVARWDPATDDAIAAPFHAGDLSPRAMCRDALRAELGLDGEGPLFASIGRFAPQKGVDLTIAAARALAGRPFELVLSGTGEESLEDAARALESELPDRVRAVVRFDETFAHRLYAGADALLMPSRYEPCGIAQMIAMRYGCVPIARETGGLADTVRDPELGPDPTGILFADASASSLAFGMRRALARFARPDSWRALQIAGMCEDFSWHRSAREYLSLYERLVVARAKGDE